MNIRNARLEDKEQVMKLVRGLYGRSAREMIEKWDKEYQRHIGGTFIAETNQKVVGYVTFGIEDDSVYIGDLYVSPKYRRKGIANSLIQVVEKARENLNKKYLRVDVRKKDRPARRLYEKLGFNFLELKGESSLKLRK